MFPVIVSSGILLLLLYLARPGTNRLAGTMPAPEAIAQNTDFHSTNSGPDNASLGRAGLRQVTPPGQAALDSGADDAAQTPEQHEARVSERVAELQDLAMNNDPASLNSILSALGDSDAPVRKAAVEAAVQFGSRDAIPALQDAAMQTEDPQEKIDLLKAVEFLKLPPLD
jgi:type VI protein secretion system component VasK